MNMTTPSLQSRRKCVVLLATAVVVLSMLGYSSSGHLNSGIGGFLAETRSFRAHRGLKTKTKTHASSPSHSKTTGTAEKGETKTEPPEGELVEESEEIPEENEEEDDYEEEEEEEEDDYEEEGEDEDVSEEEEEEEEDDEEWSEEEEIEEESEEVEIEEEVTTTETKKGATEEEEEEEVEEEEEEVEEEEEEVEEEEEEEDDDYETNHPTSKPTSKPDYTPADDDPLQIEDEEIVEEVEQELEHEEKVARTAGGFGLFLAIGAMIFTAHQMSENPDGIFASVCRLAITISGVVIKIIFMPCRKLLGAGNPHYNGHMPISTVDYSYRDPYRNNANAGFELS